jgi:hypothetical protein
MRRYSFPIHVALGLLLGSLLLFPDRLQGQDANNYSHFLSGYLFEIYKESKPANAYLVMTLSGRQMGEAGVEIECVLGNLRGNALDRAYRCELRHYSTGTGTITNPSVQEKSIAFDLHVGGSDADKKMRVRCTLDEPTGRYLVKASGTWSDQTHTEFTRVKWKQLQSIDLEYNKLLPALF